MYEKFIEIIRAPGTTAERRRKLILEELACGEIDIPCVLRGESELRAAIALLVDRPPAEAYNLMRAVQRAGVPGVPPVSRQDSKQAVPVQVDPAVGKPNTSDPGDHQGASGLCAPEPT